MNCQFRSGLKVLSDGIIDEFSIAVNGIRLNVLAAGDDKNPIILFLHGFPAYSGVWKGMLTHFSKEYRCYAPDLRGYNLSEKPKRVEDYEIQNSVLDMVHFIKATSPDKPVVVVGHDFGGFLSYALTSERPDLVRALIVINGPHKDSFKQALNTDPKQVEASKYIDFLCIPFSWLIFRWNNCSKLLSSYRSMVEPKKLTDAEEKDIVDAWSQKYALRSMFNWYRANRPALSAKTNPNLKLNQAGEYHISVPHLLIWGEDDPHLLSTCHEKLDSYCPDLEKVSIEGAGHAPYASHPDQVIKPIDEYLSRRF